MQATRKPTPKQPQQRKPHRSAALGSLSNGKTVLWLSEDGRVTNGYTLAPLPTDFGTAYRLGKADVGGCTEEYDVLLHGRETSCTCKGHTYTGHCKHVEALQALTAAGKLPVAAAASQAENKPADVQAMKLGEVQQINGHRVERMASCWKIDNQYAMTPRQIAERLQNAVAL